MRSWLLRDAERDLMKAITITSFGGVEGLEVREVAAAPRATLDRVRVRVRAAGLNRADILQRLGRYPAPPGYPQDIPGMEFAGEVEQIGDEVRRWSRRLWHLAHRRQTRKGKRVWFDRVVRC